MSTNEKEPHFLLKAWFGLTESEQLALALVLALFLLGLAVRAWHRHAGETAATAATQEKTSTVLKK